MKNTIKKSKPNYTIQIAFMILLAVLFSAGAASAATYTVTNTNNSGAGSLRQAVLDSNASAEDDTINFTASLAEQTITLTSGELSIENNGTLTINGLGADHLTISGNNLSRVFLAQANSTVTIINLTATGGKVGEFGEGGGIYNNGTLTLSNSTIKGNSAPFGGGIYNNGTLTLSNSTASGNSGGTLGGGIYNSGTLTLTNSTVSSNSAGLYGGGINNNGILTLTNSTVNGNSASFVGGIYNNGTTAIRNSIIANSTSGSDCAVNNGTITADQSLIEDGSCNIQNGVNGNKTGDPALGPLQDNGGPTFTHAILAGSPAIDAGSNALVPAGITTDQRGALRIVSTSVDIGAFESGAAVFTVNTTADFAPLSPTCQPLTATTDCTLRQAIEAANAAATDDTILFNIPTTDAGYDPLNNRYTVTLGGSELIVANSGRLLINGFGANQLTISGGGSSRILRINTNTTITLSSITISQGNGSFGGGINNNGNLTLSNSNVIGNLSSNDGGGVYNSSILTVVNTTINGNVSNGNGGGIFNFGSAVTIIHSTVNENSSNGGGGGVLSRTGTVKLGNSTISNNTSKSFFGGGIDITNGILQISNSTISNNRVVSTNSVNGGGILLFNGNATITNSTVTNNSVGGTVGAGGISRVGGILILQNTIVAGNINNSNAPDIGGAGFVSAGYNLIGNVGSVSAFNQTGDQTGNSDVPLDPMLGPLQDNGGQTFTHELLAGSPAINAGSDALAVDTNNDPLTTDQRGIGFPRIIGRVDIGAFESSVSDLTPPVITPNVSGTLGNNDWYISDIEISWSVTDDESSVSNQTGCETTTVIEDTSGITFTCMATSAGGTSSQNVTVKRDATAPDITYVSRTAANSSGWNNSDVTVNWTCTDDLSGVVSPTDVKTVSTEGLNQSVNGSCTDNAGNSVSDTQSGINIDLTAPTLSPTVSPNPVLLNGSATASPNAADALSGISSQSCGAVDTSSVGFKTVSCTATDLAGNTANADASYQVVYNFAGFFQPVDNLPTLNIVSAGQAIPIKFSLNGYQGMGIFAAGYPASSLVACDANEPGNTIEETVNAGGSSLTYDAAADRYSYVWKTNKTWNGSCRILVVRFIDGTEHYAKFRFK